MRPAQVKKSNGEFAARRQRESLFVTNRSRSTTPGTLPKHTRSDCIVPDDTGVGCQTSTRPPGSTWRKDLSKARQVSDWMVCCGVGVPRKIRQALTQISSICCSRKGVLTEAVILTLLKCCRTYRKSVVCSITCGIFSVFGTFLTSPLNKAILTCLISQIIRLFHYFRLFE